MDPSDNTAAPTHESPLGANEGEKKERFKKLLWNGRGRKITTVVLCLLLACLAATGVYFQVFIENDQHQSQNARLVAADDHVNRDCGTTKQLLKNSPIATKDLSTIIPLGNFAPPGHIGATGHLYYNFLNQGTRTNVLPAKTTIYAPADMTVTSISLFDNASAIKPFNSYRIDFSICKQVTGYFIHTMGLSEKLSAAMQPPYTSTQESKITGTVTEHVYNKQLNIKLKAGEIMGTSGGSVDAPWGLDFGLVDLRSPNPVLANQARWKHDSHYVCSLDYYPPELSKVMYEHIGNYSFEYLNPGEPRCGTVYQDLPGTAQGAWFTADSPRDKLGDPAQQIALAHSNFDHSQAVFSFGSRVTSIGVDANGVYSFTPVESGQVNRDFSKVTPDHKIYCYQLKHPSDFSRPDTVILLQILESGTLRLGKLPGNKCGAGPWQFTQYIDYVR